MNWGRKARNIWEEDILEQQCFFLFFSVCISLNETFLSIQYK
jgi:hypothetical protein